jgi:hypothetical protein
MSAPKYTDEQIARMEANRLKALQRKAQKHTDINTESTTKNEAYLLYFFILLRKCLLI